MSIKKTTIKQEDITLEVFCWSWIWETSPFFFADVFVCFACEDDETLVDEEAVEDCTRKYEYKENDYETKRRWQNLHQVIIVSINNSIHLKFQKKNIANSILHTDVIAVQGQIHMQLARLDRE